MNFNTSLRFPLNHSLDHLVQFISLFVKLGWLFLVSLLSLDDIEIVVYQDIRLAKDTYKYSDSYNKSNNNKDYIENRTSDKYRIGSYNAYVNLRMPSGGVSAIYGNWICGENGLYDWYYQVPRQTNWAFANDNVEVHFSEMFVCKNTI